MAFVFSKDLETGHPLIDKEHRELIEKINDFYYACQKGVANEKILEMFHFLETYVAQHFRHEEDVQRRCGYPNYKEHKQQHTYFEMRIKDIKNRLIENDKSLNMIVEINQTVGFWLIGHIRHEDIALSNYLKDKNHPLDCSFLG